jgi:hypothetical protein
MLGLRNRKRNNSVAAPNKTQKLGMRGTVRFVRSKTVFLSFEIFVSQNKVRMWERSR